MVSPRSQGCMFNNISLHMTVNLTVNQFLSKFAKKIQIFSNYRVGKEDEPVRGEGDNNWGFLNQKFVKEASNIPA